MLFGFLDGSPATAADEVSHSLGIAFVLHDSLWRGGDYYLYEAGSEEIIIQRNNDGGAPDDPAEDSFPEYPVLMYVQTDRSEELMAILGTCRSRPRLLR
jgi:hypothetical protein